MNIIYVLTIIAIYTIFILIHKTNKKQNLFLWLNISWILILCYNIIVCLIYSLLGILCTILNLTIFNTVILLILGFVLLKNKKIQKYYIKIADIIYALIILSIVVFIAYEQYGFPFNIKYSITDASTHYFFAEQFYEKSTLLYNDNGDILGTYQSNFRLPGAYVNEGILFKVFEGILLKIDIFILFDLCVLYLSGILFYYLLKINIKENKKMNIIICIFSIIYMLGYPLNSMLSGFVYLSLALDIIIALLILISMSEKEELKEKVILPILSLVSFGVFFAYAYFIPIIYISIIIYLVKKNKENNTKFFDIKNLVTILYLIIIPGILGIAYFIIFPLASQIESEVSTIGVEGTIYTNYITNYLVFIPIYIIYFVTSLKRKKENNIGVILFILSILFAIILLIGRQLEIVSNYYFFKNYYIIWILSIYTFIVMLDYILNYENKCLNKIIYTFTIVYIIVMIGSSLAGKNIGINDILYKNISLIKFQEYSVKREEFRIAEEIKNNIDIKDIYVFPGNNILRLFWMTTLYDNQLIYIDGLTGFFINVEEWLQEKEETYYFAYYEDYGDVNLEENIDQYDIIYKDDYGFLLKRK